MDQKAPDAGYGVMLFIGLFAGFAVGLMVAQPSAGAVIGLGFGGLVAIGLRFRPRR